MRILVGTGMVGLGNDEGESMSEATGPQPARASGTVVIGGDLEVHRLG
ncbi:MAG: hypothetical protein ACT4PW_14495 [Acidimicrobiia bacterium]